MSKDIRSFFLPKKLQKHDLEDDDEVIPESPAVAIKTKKKEKRRINVICDDSDDDTFVTKKKKSTHPNKKLETASKSSSLKEVKVVDLFGGSKVKQTEPLIRNKKKKTETGIHSDEEFDKSLLELDACDNIESNNVQKKIVSPKEDNHHVTNNLKDKINNPQSKILKEEGDTGSLKVYNKTTYDNTSKTVNVDQSKSKLEHRKEQLQKHQSGSKDKNEKKRYFSELIEHNDTSLGLDEEPPKSKRKHNKSLNESEQLQKHQSGSKDKNEKKRNFSELMEHNDTSLGLDEEPPKSKRKHNKSLNESVLTDEERHERKMHSSALYQKYLNRSGPKHLGAKQIPEGSPNCLCNCAFLLTGVLDSFEREEIASAIVELGGTVKNGISRKVTHVLAGEDAGPAKISKAEELGIKIINEDEFLQLIKDLSNKQNKSKVKKTDSDSKTKDLKQIKKEKFSPQDKKQINDLSKHSGNKKESKISKVEDNADHKIKETKSNIKQDKIKSEKVTKISEIKNEIDEKVTETKNTTPIQQEHSTSSSAQAALMWVDKYKPQTVKQIIGQHGDASNVKKLTNWLTKWYLNRKAKIPKPSPWAKNDDGGFYKAALLSGPPGVGKTTTVSLVCKELGFDVVELNASDTRNKSLMRDQIGELLTTTSLSRYAKGETGKQAVSIKHVLVMDEVDGMAGNEDRGGLQELIGLIKSTSVPIICMCNDRNSQKMRSLVNYCYDLRFTRPRVDQIKSSMLSICFKEGIKIPPDTLSQLIVSANQDVRQTLNLLSMWAVEPKLADADSLNRDVKTARKDVKLGPWEAVRKVFSADEHKTMSLIDKSDLFFYDYSLAPLFVQENYLHVTPHCPKNEILQRVSEAADSISIGDIVEAKIRRSQAWHLLPMQAMFSSVIPGTVLSGHVSGQIQFPGWLGKNSRANKMHRLCQEIHSHTRLSTSGSKSSVYLDYAPHLRDAIIKPLIKNHSQGVDAALHTLECYHLLRDDLDSLLELSTWPGQPNPMALVDSKVKAAMTRTYNKKATSLPYAPGLIKKVKREDNEYEENTEDNEEEVEQDSDPENDAMIKKKKTKDTEKSSLKEKKDKAPSSQVKASSSKERKKKK